MIINSFLRQYTPSRFHMPGHDGREHPFDITEVTGAGDLYSTSGLIAQSEQAASRFNGVHTSYSAGGSTLCIQTMAALLKEKGVTKIAAYNDYHVALKNACDLLGIELIETQTLSDVDALWVTSPTYLGKISDIKKIAEQCKKQGIYLAVDNAHGAHLFDNHPMLLGADLCNDSAHKTLPCLTGGAFLHIREDFASKFAAKDAMLRFGSTSPSYLILASLERASEYLKTSAQKDFTKLAQTYAALNEIAVSHGFHPQEEQNDITKFVLRKNNMTGAEILKSLHKHKIEPELVGENYVLLMLSPFNKKKDYKRLNRFFKEY
jgi:Arginine/lysine/ornithine decarboxylases